MHVFLIRWVIFSCSVFFFFSSLSRIHFRINNCTQFVFIHIEKCGLIRCLADFKVCHYEKKKKKVIFFLCFAFTIFSIAESFDGMGMKTIQNEERIFEITSTIAAVQSSMYPCTAMTNGNDSKSADLFYWDPFDRK